MYSKRQNHVFSSSFSLFLPSRLTILNDSMFFFSNTIYSYITPLFFSSPKRIRKKSVDSFTSSTKTDPIMNYPTGMGHATGNHYNNVAAQMQAYLHNGGGGSGGGGGGGQSLHAAHGQMNQFQPSRGLAFASNSFQGGASRFGIDPVISNDVGGFARKFMINLLI
jgi:hypothetical protein